MSLNTDLTYLQLRQRIVGNLNRDDLDTNPLSSASVVHQFVLDRVNHYSKEFFYNAQFIDTSKSTVVGDTWVDLPDGWQQVNYVRINIGNLWVPIGNGRPIPYTSLLQMDAVVPSIQSIPASFTLYQNPTGGKMAIRMFPAPDAVYPLEFTMDKPPDAPASDAEISFWTCDAQTLVIDSVCEEICRKRLSRPIKAEEHRKGKEEAEMALASKTIRISGGLRAKVNW